MKEEERAIMASAKFLAYSLCDKLERKTVDGVIGGFLSNGWTVKETGWSAKPFDGSMPAFDRGWDFEINFPDALSSRVEFLTCGDGIVRARARLQFKQALIFSKASRHVAHLISSLDYYYGRSHWAAVEPSVHAAQYQNAYTMAYVTRTISGGLDSVVYCVGNSRFWRYKYAE